MSAFRSLIGELEVALRVGSSAKRTDLLRRITDLFLGGVDTFSTEQISLFDDVLIRLIDQIETQVLAELSGRLASVDSAPEGVVRRLAWDDDIAISGPILQHSPRLSDGELVEIAKSKSQEHLFKISGRSQLNEDVTDVLVDRGDSAVLNEVAGNGRAHFSKIGLAKLVICADGDDGLTTTVAGRADIPPLLLRQLLARATDMVRERLMASARPEVREAIRKAVFCTYRKMSRSLVPRRYGQAEALVRIFSQDTELTRSQIMRFADMRRIEETVVALSVLTAVPIDLVDALVHDPGFLGVLVLCKAVGLEWRVAYSVMLTAGTAGEGPTPRGENLRDEYEQLAASTAQRLLRFWQARHELSARPVQ